MSAIPKRPTKQIVDRFINKFKKNKRYFPADQAIAELFRQYPKNTNLNHVLLKVTILDKLYSTGIFFPVDMARHIVSLKIDAKLQNQSTEVVDCISRAEFNKKRRHVFSFATKYCSWHDSANYPIYDTYVAQLLTAYSRRDAFAVFEKAELRNYARYKEIVSAFRKYYTLDDYSFKEMDKFLWIYGKELFKKEARK